MKATNYRDLSIDELSKREIDIREELFNLRYQHSTHQLENTSRLCLLKKDIARIKTIIKEKQNG
jgi:large subunit ribosomal protein L29